MDTQRERALQRAAVLDVEMQALERQYREELRSAFADALGGLTSRQRAILRLSVVEGLSGTKIAELYGVDRATGKRWLAAVRRDLFEGTKVALTRRLAMETRDFESIVRLVQSQLDVSVVRLLGESPSVAQSE